MSEYPLDGAACAAGDAVGSVMVEAPVGSGGPATQSDARAALRTGETLLEAGRLAEARHHVDAALATHPASVALLALAARIASAAGDHAAAVLRLEAIVPLAPDRLATYGELAKALRKLGRLDASDAALAQILDRDPHRPSAHRGLAENAALRQRVAARRRPDEHASADATTAAPDALPSRAPAASPGDDAADLERQAAAARRAGDPAAAVSLLRRAAEARPDRLPIWRDLAGDLRALGRLDEADEALRRILAVDPARLSAHQGLAENARRRGDTRAAASHLAAAVGHHPGDPILRRRLVEALRHAGDAGALAVAIDAMARDFPTDVDALLAAASSAQALGREAEAAAWIDRAAALAPHGAAAVVLAAALGRAGRRAEAKGVLSRATDAVPEADGLVALAKLHAEAGETEAACLAYEKAIATERGDVRAWTGLAGLAAKSASAAQALTILTQARAALGESLALDLAEFDLLRNAGRDGDAERLLAAARARAPLDPSLRSRQIALDLDFGRYDAVEAAEASLEVRTGKQQGAAAMAAGRLAEARWDLPRALETFRRALAIDEGNGAAHAAAARVLVGLLRPLEARHHLAAAKQLSRDEQRARGRSLNPSQSLVGQLMTECWSNRAAMELGQAAIEADRLDAFLALADEEGDYTPGAIAFLVFLRRHGLLATRPPDGDAAAIPKRVLQFWDTEAVADDVAELMASWRDENPDWEHVRYSDRTARTFLEGLADPRPRRAYRSARKPAQKADLLRLALLFHHGGVYADADDRCTAPLAPVVAGRHFVAAQEARGSIGNNFIAAAPGHPLIGAALELAVTAMLRGDADTIWLSTGPGLLTRAFAAHLAASEANRADLGRGLVVLERPELRRFCAPACKVAYKTTTRHWSKEEFGQAV